MNKKAIRVGTLTALMVPAIAFTVVEATNKNTKNNVKNLDQKTPTSKYKLGYKI